MSSGKVQQNLFIYIPQTIAPHLDISTIYLDDPNKIIFNKIGNIAILNQLYQKVVKIHQILLNNKDLSNTQKFDFCKAERYFMKQYLKDVIKKLE